MSFDDVLTYAREMRFADKSDQDLHQMLIFCGNRTGQSSDIYSTNQIRHTVKMIQEELARRQREKNHKEAIAEQQRLNQKATEQGSTLHAETISEVEKIKTSVDRLHRTRRIEWWILTVGAIAAIAGAVAVLIELFRGH